MKRYAIIRNADSRNHAEAYLPDNYKVVAEVIERTERFNCVAPGGFTPDDKLVFVIEGEDKAGWTLDGYVIPRYASGLIGAEEIDLSHPIMKTIPLETKRERLNSPHGTLLCSALLSRGADHSVYGGKLDADGVCLDCGRQNAVTA